MGGGGGGRDNGWNPFRGTIDFFDDVLFLKSFQLGLNFITKMTWNTAVFSCYWWDGLVYVYFDMTVFKFPRPITQTSIFV